MKIFAFIISLSILSSTAYAEDLLTETKNTAEQLREKESSLTDELSNLGDTKSQLESDISDLNASKAALEKDIEKLTTELEEYQKEFPGSFEEEIARLIKDISIKRNELNKLNALESQLRLEINRIHSVVDGAINKYCAVENIEAEKLIRLKEYLKSKYGWIRKFFDIYGYVAPITFAYNHLDTEFEELQALQNGRSEISSIFAALQKKYPGTSPFYITSISCQNRVYKDIDYRNDQSKYPYIANEDSIGIVNSTLYLLNGWLQAIDALKGLHQQKLEVIMGVIL